ncbi:MAG TPA: DJ-1/PfpI family protein [Thermoanaerobaculia bacterium]|jgi:cyclohexyl-isocyanide hydratase|nr:DJ-1/PfpI family protein [Thermoanaerobaculia bacterium]
MSQDNAIAVGFPLFEEADLLDVTIPLELLAFLERPAVRVQLIGRSLAEPVTLMPGKIRMMPDTTFQSCPQLDVLMVPGGSGVLAAMKDKSYLDFIRHQAAKARYVAAVCAGSLPLAAAGLLNGYTATTHWASLSALHLFPQVNVAPGYPRYVLSGNRITTGGVSSGIDMALALCALLGGEEQAKQVQLLIQYAPQPPYQAGDPTTADAVTWGQACKRLEPLRESRVDFIRTLLGLKP